MSQSMLEMKLPRLGTALTIRSHEIRIDGVSPYTLLRHLLDYYGFDNWPVVCALTIAKKLAEYPDRADDEDVDEVDEVSAAAILGNMKRIAGKLLHVMPGMAADTRKQLEQLATARDLREAA